MVSAFYFLLANLLQHDPSVEMSSSTEEYRQETLLLQCRAVHAPRPSKAAEGAVILHLSGTPHGTFADAISQKVMKSLHVQSCHVPALANANGNI